MERSLKSKLSLMMFMQYSVSGFLLPIISHYLLNHLHFTAFQVGRVMAMPAIAAILSPFLMTYVVDRLISAERLLAVCHFASGLVMLFLARQTEFGPFLLVYVLHGILFYPTFALTNAVAFHHIKDAKRDFGSIRMWGPVSWVVVAFSFSFLWVRGGGGGMLNDRLPHALLFCGGASLLLGVYSLTLPSSEAKHDRPASLPIWKAAHMFLRPGMMLLGVLTVFNSIVHQFYYYAMAPFISQLGIPDAYIMPIMSMGQLGEVFVLATLGFFLSRMRVKTALLIGVLAQAFRTFIFAWGNPYAVIATIPMHGICYAFFFAVAFIYVDTHSTRHTRGGAQQLFNILISGFGNFAGSLLAGLAAKTLLIRGTLLIDYQAYWFVSAVAALVIGVILFAGFREEAPATETASAT